jgi:riboflavin transporter FmnP
MEKSSKKLVLTGFFIALGFILPFFTGQIPSIGNKLLPMHIPILLCGFVCGWRYGLIAGFITPITRSLVYGMPPMIPIAASMAFELAAYGLIAGLLYKNLPKAN